MAIAWGNLGILDCVGGNLPLALSQFQEVLKLKREIGDPDSISYTLVYLGTVSTSAGKFADAHRYLDEAMSILQAIHEEPVGIKVRIAELAIAEGRPEAAEAPMLVIAAKYKTPNAAGHAWCVLAQQLAYLRRGNLAKAHEASVAAVEWAAKTPNRADFGVPAGLIAARVAMAEGHTTQTRNSLNAPCRIAQVKTPPQRTCRSSRPCRVGPQDGQSAPAAAAGMRTLAADSSRQGFSFTPDGRRTGFAAAIKRERVKSH